MFFNVMGQINLYSFGSLYDNMGGSSFTPSPPPVTGKLLLENGSFTLLENGGKILLEG